MANESKDNQADLFVLPNLEKRIEEAIHDAIAHFDKKCPFCDIPLFDTHIRSRYEIDHYTPISKGGQHVPWNVLPVCRNCNRAKRSTLPSEFLSEDRQQQCEKYLSAIRTRLVGSVQADLETLQLIRHELSIVADWSERPATSELESLVFRLADLAGVRRSERIESANGTVHQEVLKGLLYLVHSGSNEEGFVSRSDRMFVLSESLLRTVHRIGDKRLTLHDIASVLRVLCTSDQRHNPYTLEEARHLGRRRWYEIRFSAMNAQISLDKSLDRGFLA